MKGLVSTIDIRPHISKKGGITVDTLFVINAVFDTGQIVATRGVYDMASENPDFARFIQKSLNRHVQADWTPFIKPL